MTQECTIIDGKAVASDLRSALSKHISTLTVKPGLAVLLVGNDPASAVYVKNKIKACREVGINSLEKRLPSSIQEEELFAEIDALNEDPSVHGILLQLPLPPGLSAQAAISRIRPDKDVDGLHPQNIGQLVSGGTGFVPCTPEGVSILLKIVQEDMSGLHAVIIGRSLLFGKPMAQLLLRENCTVTQCHSRSRDLPSLCRQADILIAAAGQARMVKKDWVKKGAIVIDVGINRLEKAENPAQTELVGDVDYEAVKKRASAITPVPGGVGPMTIACLLANTVKACAGIKKVP